jgi:hypothetical protein
MAGNISDQTTVLSNLSLDRNLSSGTVEATSGISVGGGKLLTRVSAGTFAVAAITVANASSTTTAATISPLATSDVIVVNPSSVLSANVLLGQAFVSAASTVILSFLNASATTAVVAAQTMSYTAFRS